MAPEDSAALAKLAAIAGYSDEHLSLIAEANMPHYRPGDELTAAQMSGLYSAAEMCYESGLRAAAVAATIEHYRQSGPEGWRASFWHERIRRVQDREALPEPPGPQPLTPPPVPVPPTGPTPPGGLPGQRTREQENVSSAAADHRSGATTPAGGWAGEVPIALGGTSRAVAPLPDAIAPQPVATASAARMPGAIEPQAP